MKHKNRTDFDRGFKNNIVYKNDSLFTTAHFSRRDPGQFYRLAHQPASKNLIVNIARLWLTDQNSFQLNFFRWKFLVSRAVFIEFGLTFWSAIQTEFLGKVLLENDSVLPSEVFRYKLWIKLVSSRDGSVWNISFEAVFFRSYETFESTCQFFNLKLNLAEISWAIIIFNFKISFRLKLNDRGGFARLRASRNHDKMRFD